jgi:N-acetyl-gamma-glutamyl-phosphate reductase common form
MREMPVKVAIVGATGYAGGELARLLLRHPEADLVATVARGRQGEPLRDVQPHLHSAPASLTVGADPGDAEVVFTALPAGEAAKLAPAWLAEGRSVIDIGSDFRLRDPKDYERWYGYTHPAPELLKEAVYGLTELARDRLRGARVIANPGCYPTATLLALLPALPTSSKTISSSTRSRASPAPATTSTMRISSGRSMRACDRTAYRSIAISQRSRRRCVGCRAGRRASRSPRISSR